MKPRRPLIPHLLLFLYIAISLTYQIVASVSLIVGYFDLRHQVQAPFEIAFERPVIASVKAPAKQAGLAVGDRIESLNGIPYKGRALWQGIRWYAHSGDVVRMGVLRKDGTRAAIAVPFSGLSKGALANKSPNDIHIAEAAFVIFLHIVVPLFCLALGYWVALARPQDLHAWFILILLSVPQAYISISTNNWWPGIWFPLRLNWHITLEILAPGALLWLGLLFPERSRIDVRLPWLKWLVTAILVSGIAVGLLTDYTAWYDLDLLPNWPVIDGLNDKVLNWTIVSCLVLYWVSIFDKLRTASTPDATRRLRVLCAGSVVGLGSVLLIFGALPFFGIADPSGIQWLGYLGAVLMLAFPLSLAYVVVVQRALDVRILLRMGTKYAMARGVIWTLRAVLIAAIIVVFWQTARASQFGGPDVVRLAALGVPLFVISPRVFGPLSNWIDRRFFRESYNADLILSELSERVRQFTETAPLIETVSRRISEVLHVPEVAVLLRRGGSFQLYHAVGVTATGPLLLFERSPTVEYVRQTNRPAVLYRDNPSQWYTEADDQEKRALSEMHAELLLALPGRQRLMGIIALGRKKSEEPYSPSDLRLLQSVGAQTGLALEVSELAHSLAAEASQRARVDREIEIAREVQERLFPQHIPTVPGLTVAGACRPAQGVGGDYYDIIELEDGRLGLAIGDVSGKGISAALLMASLRACLRTMMLLGRMDLDRLMRKMNRLVYESSAANRYATFFFSIYDPSTRTLDYVNAGHNPPFLLPESSGDKNGLRRLEASGTVIGLLPNVSYEQQSLTLNKGDVLLAYTDGISEAMTETDQEWGEERMLQAAEAVCKSGAQEIVRTLFSAADRFTGSAPQHDDMTLLVLKVEA